MPTKPGVIYALEWKAVKDATTGLPNYSLARIYDTSIQIDNSLDEQVISITPAGDPCRISTDRQEDKYKPPIRAKKATLKFLNSDAVNYETFATGEDLRFFVTVEIEGVPVFVGWLQQGDIFEPFLPQQNQEVTLTAIDGLAFLKGEQLTDLSGNKLSGKYRIAEIINFCLRKTGLVLNTYVINNLREQFNPDVWTTGPGDITFISPNTIHVPVEFADYWKIGSTISISGSASNNGNKVIINRSSGVVTTSGGITNETAATTITWQDITTFGNIYQCLYLDAKSFEEKPGTTIDCYTILERILGHDCILDQYLGNWYIRRVKEFRIDLGNTRALFSNTGNIVSEANFTEQRAIGLKDVTGTPFPMSPDATAFFSKAQTQRTRLRPEKSVKLINKFEMPALPCNADFSQGDLSVIVTPDDKHYNLDSWTLEHNLPASGGPSCITYIRRLFENDYRKSERYAVITNPITTPSMDYIRSCDIPLSLKDKFSFSIDYAWSQNNGSGPLTVTIAIILLYGDDGTYWTLDNNGKWFQSNASWSVNQKHLDVNWETGDVDETLWRTLSVDADPLPVGGAVQILLFAMNQQPSTSIDNVDMYYQNLRFEYIPFINGVYMNFTGQSFTTTRDGNYKSKIEDQVYMGGYPKAVFKWALFKKNNLGKYVLVDLFYEGQEYATANDGRNHLAAYGELQVRGFHNQCRNSNEMYQLTAQGLNSFNNTDLVHAIFNRDLEPNSNVKTYQLCWLEQDFRRCEWTGTMIKNFDVALGFATDTFVFNYETT